MEKFNELLNQYKLPLGLSLVGLVLILGGSFSSGLFHSSKPKEIPKSSLVADPGGVLAQIKVDISGAVVSRGVHVLNKDSRVEDAIKAAGGFSSQVSSQFVSQKLNLSAKLIDGQKLYIPAVGESNVAGVAMAVSGTTQTSLTGVTTLVGLNSATQAELEALPGVGPVTAQKIITTRPYSDISELSSKKVVSKSVFSKISPMVDLH